MSQKDLNDLVENYLDLDKKSKELQIALESTKNSIKKEMEFRQLEECICGKHVVRCKEVLTSVFDKTKFKAKYEELYTMFLKQVPSKKFSIS